MPTITSRHLLVTTCDFALTSVQWTARRHYTCPRKVGLFENIIFLTMGQSISLEKNKVACCSLLFTAYGIYVISAWYSERKIQNQRYKEAQQERSSRDDQLAKVKQKMQTFGITKAASDAITELPLKSLLQRLRSGELKPTQVLRAYQYSALATHQKTNCLTKIMTEAEEWAHELDGLSNRSGLLCGVPVSLKDSIPTRGHSHTLGVVGALQNISRQDSMLVSVFKAEGAVPFVKTNASQLGLSIETSNPIYGTTSNPHDPTRIPGGSTGGEGALIADGGSILGVGTDFGGSIRLPAVFCGICGLKPTRGRVSLRGRDPVGQTIYSTTFGPMARNVGSLVIFMKAILSGKMFNEDCDVPPLPFNDDIFQSTRPLTIGYYTDIGLYNASPCVERAILDTKAALESLGHTLVPWQPPNIKLVASFLYQSFSGDQGENFKMMQSDIVDTCIRGAMELFTMSPVARALRAWLAEKKGHSWLASTIRLCAGFGTVAEWWQHTTRVQKYQQQFEDAWKSAGLDALICPPHVLPATKMGKGSMHNRMYHFTSLYNLLDYPAGVLPITRVTRADIAALDTYTTPDDIADFARQDLQGGEGLPVGVQCVALKWREETCLRVMTDVERVIDYNRRAPK